MILSTEQAQQYYRIFNPFLLFLTDWFKERGTLDRIIDRHHVYADYELVCALLDAVFRKGGHREAIDAFVDAHKGDLSQQDIDVALGWKHAVSAEYYAVRRGEDVFFVDGADVYAVCGITHELDDRFLDLPMHVFTYLVPFQERITYLTVMRQLSTRLPRNVGEELLARVDEATKGGRIMRTGAEFIRGTGAGEDGTEQRQSSDIADSAGLTVHAGPLAGLTWDQRQAEFVRYMDGLTDMDALLDSLDRDCLPGEPTRAYRDMISRSSMSELRRFARLHDVYDELTREGYVDLMADIFVPRLPKFTDDLRKLGIRFMRDMRDLCEQGGEMRFSKDEIERREDMPRRVFPHVAYFDGDEEYVVVLSDEARSLCEHIDWEAELARAERLEEALAFVDVATDHRGLIARREVMGELSRRFADVDVTDIEDALERRSNNYLIHLVPAWFDGGDYLVAEDLLTDEDDFYADIMHDILSRRRVRRAAWPTPEQVAQGGLVKAWESYDEGRRLAAFFDERVPVTHDGYRYAYDAVTSLVYAAQHVWDGHEWLRQALSFFAHGGVEEEELRPMLQDLYNALPNRYCNGSIPRYAWERDAASRVAAPKAATSRRPKKKRPTKRRRR